ncbi:hypothetical protein EIN_187180 [Entamoeba invadens IP1]|uniref:hypothetical protein n=1 Tax=Entamoeba invadens IP1 TaxID=370355 RepID=UPI0002C3E268|nr:hypothetical protein EIN_187180 [Entamoeba invadens IP1]ELP94261.1 hypothetical protein EIN_187180 [Entamoeba invadens IP1]|eukprot:XP_004261032.1 hypothetical protein EIN_187180 [Entamoeba invadens IP1]
MKKQMIYEVQMESNFTQETVPQPVEENITEPILNEELVKEQSQQTVDETTITTELHDVVHNFVQDTLKTVVTTEETYAPKTEVLSLKEELKVPEGTTQQEIVEEVKPSDVIEVKEEVKVEEKPIEDIKQQDVIEELPPVKEEVIEQNEPRFHLPSPVAPQKKEYPPPLSINPLSLQQNVQNNKTEDLKDQKQDAESVPSTSPPLDTQNKQQQNFTQVLRPIEVQTTQQLQQNIQYQQAQEEPRVPFVPPEVTQVEATTNPYEPFSSPLVCAPVEQKHDKDGNVLGWEDVEIDRDEMVQLNKMWKDLKKDLTKDQRKIISAYIMYKADHVAYKKLKKFLKQEKREHEEEDRKMEKVKKTDKHERKYYQQSFDKKDKKWEKKEMKHFCKCKPREMRYPLNTHYSPLFMNQQTPQPMFQTIPIPQQQSQQVPQQLSPQPNIPPQQEEIRNEVEQSRIDDNQQVPQQDITKIQKIDRTPLQQQQVQQQMMTQSLPPNFISMPYVVQQQIDPLRTQQVFQPYIQQPIIQQPFVQQPYIQQPFLQQQYIQPQLQQVQQPFVLQGMPFPQTMNYS